MPIPERELIARIRRAASRRDRRIPAGIGDDCAVLRLPPGHDSLVTTDFSLEGIHFRRDWHPPETVGQRCLVRGLSDIAAMGGEPVAVFLSLALPRDLPQAWVARFMDRVIAIAREQGATLAGGDTAESPGGILADIVVVGSVPRGKAILRSGARPGDRIYASGTLGGSAAAIQALQAIERNRDRRNDRSRDDRAEFPRHFHPEPRLELGRWLRERGLATAMIDTSDGLSTDLAHVCEESKVGAVIDAALVPRARVGKPRREVELDLALHGGEDYELLFTAAPGMRVPGRIAGVRVTAIGEITRGRRILLRSETGAAIALKPRGWEHFRK